MIGKNSHAEEDHPLKALPLVDQIFKLKSFRMTKQRIKNGDPLWDYSADDLKENGLLGPWAINFYESFLYMIWGQTLKAEYA